MGCDTHGKNSFEKKEFWLYRTRVLHEKFVEGFELEIPSNTAANYNVFATAFPI